MNGRVTRRLILIIAVYALSMWAGAASNAVAQGGVSPNPTVSVACSPAAIPIEVHPGAQRTGTTYCTATNPTQYIEDVTITVTAGGLAVAYPGLITIGAYDSSTFEVVIRGDNRMAEGSRTITITARVVSASGMPCTTCPTVSSAVLATIMQFSRLRVEADEPFKQLRPNVDYIFEFKVYNDGNAYDRFNIDIVNRDDLEEKDFQITLPTMSTEIEPQAPADKMRVMLRTPKIQGWTDEYHQLQFRATSEYSVRTEGVPNYQTQMITIYVRGIYLPGFELMPSLSMIALGAAFAARRRNQEEFDESLNLTPISAPGL
jgi:hypothetical protein